MTARLANLTSLSRAAVHRHCERRPLFWAFAAYSVLTIAVTFPLILNLSSHLPKDLGDPLLTASLLWWNASVMPLTERWWNGFAFFPATGMMAYSEHALGAGLLASPLQWLGSGPIVAYNLTFLASFPLSALAAHFLALTLCRRHDASFVCGLAYGFNPYRVAHVEHLELLLAFGMPAALAALHQYAETGRARWLVALAIALTVQALSTSYYALFFTVLVAGWLIWFMRPRAWRRVLGILAAGAVSVLAVSPLFLGYIRIHRSLSLTRELSEVLQFSGDLSSLVTASPLSALWGWTSFLNGGERQLFPGMVITLLAAAGVWLSRGPSRPDRDRLTIVAMICWGLSASFAAVAAGLHLAGPWQLEWGWLTVSATVIHKPISLALAFAILAIALGPSMRQAFRQRSPYAFYLGAAAMLFLCTLGPKPTLFGEQILYEPPYAWLMRLPFFSDTVRVPARFAMLGALALAVAGALSVQRLTSLTRRTMVPLAIVMAGIVADGWISRLPLAPVPRNDYELPRDDPSPVMELPLGDVWRDTAALYRVTLSGTRSVNGYNGHEPSPYQVLRRALDDRDPTVLDALAALGPLLIAADNSVDRDQPWASFVSSHPQVSRLGDQHEWTIFRLSPKPVRTHERCAGQPIGIAAAVDRHGPIDVATLTDQDPATRWITPGPQATGDLLILDLGRVERVCGVNVSMGSAGVLYPGMLTVATSVDQSAWDSGFAGATGGSAFRAALASPGNARFSIALKPRAARFVRLRVERSHPRYHWAVADAIVEGHLQ